MRLVKFLSVTDTNQHLDFYPTCYFVVRPCVFIQLEEGGAAPPHALVMEYKADIKANVYTGINISWPQGSLGKKYSLLILDA